MPVQDDDLQTRAPLRDSPVFPQTFDWNAINQDCRVPLRPCTVVGIRPKRRGKYKLEIDEVGDRLFCHNYGHGGAGITMSWGCAEAVHKLINAERPVADQPEIAILGAGVMGLTAAMVLAENGYENIKIYSSKISPNTTSDIAGGQWSPSAVDIGTSSQDLAVFDGIMRDAHARFTSQIGAGWGVVERDNFVHRDGDLGSSFERIPSGLLTMTKLNRLPFDSKFEHHSDGGWKVETLLVEPPVFMAKLMSELATKFGIVPEIRKFASRAEVEQLDEKVIVNCTGYGARKLFGDNEVKALRGQLVLLPAQTNLDYLFSAGNSYVFPRSDGLVLGGTFQSSSNTTVSERDARSIWRRDKKIFENGPRSSGRGLVGALRRLAEKGLATLSGGEDPTTYTYEIDGETYDDT